MVWCVTQRYAWAVFACQLQEGGAIFQERWATFVFNGPASFVNNKAWNVSISTDTNCQGYYDKTTRWDGILRERFHQLMHMYVIEPTSRSLSSKKNSPRPTQCILLWFEPLYLMVFTSRCTVIWYLSHPFAGSFVAERYVTKAVMLRLIVEATLNLTLHWALAMVVSEERSTTTTVAS